MSVILGTKQIFVLMQFDPGVEYKPNRGEQPVGITKAITGNPVAAANAAAGTVAIAGNTANNGLTGNPINSKDDNS